MTPPEIEGREMRAPAMIEATFRNGSLSAISVILGFSLAFLTRWSALPGSWTRFDILAVILIAVGLVLEIVAVAALLSTGSLRASHYNRSIVVFLAGLAVVSLGIGFAIAGDIFASSGGQRPVPAEASRPQID